MKEALFEELLASVREGGAILRGEKKPSRSFVMAAPARRDSPDVPPLVIRDKSVHE